MIFDTYAVLNIIPGTRSTLIDKNIHLILFVDVPYPHFIRCYIFSNTPLTLIIDILRQLVRVTSSFTLDIMITCLQDCRNKIKGATIGFPGLAVGKSRRKEDDFLRQCRTCESTVELSDAATAETCLLRLLPYARPAHEKA